MKRGTDEEIKQYSVRINGPLSQESLRETHTIVDNNNVWEIQRWCENCNLLSSKPLLSSKLLECFVYAVHVPQAEIAYTILEKFHDDEKIKEAMEQFEVDDIACGGAMRVVKQWSTMQSREYQAVFKVFIELGDKVYDFVSSLPEILHYSLLKIWGFENEEKAREKVWPPNKWGDMDGLSDNEKLLADTAIEACKSRQNTTYTTQPAKFMECFIEAAVMDSLRTKFRDAKAGKGVSRQGEQE